MKIIAGVKRMDKLREEVGVRESLKRKLMRRRLKGLDIWK